ncbi:MAG: fatty acid--CoA ligase [Gammaproteobacteria bacterium]|jgi:fatty-acyl-CoA synthase|nr:long-chain fatty acid--CoA ligase [Chromatiales bacterium]MDP6674232.1 fatty acid--CoA ligase [Gammaproteobacteria bacterium]
MSNHRLTPAASAYDYPLIIRHLLRTPLTQARNQEIIYADKRRYSYTTFNERLGRLANTLAEFGIRAGDTVAVMDWDSNRYLETFFAVPMIGAVLHTINIRLSPGQILYTINHAQDDIILVHADFMPIIDEIRDRFERDIRILPLADYETLLNAASPDYDFPDFDENTRATTFYTTGTTGLPKGVYFTHRQLVLHTLGFMSTVNWTSGHGGFHSDDVYMPITPMFHVHAWGAPYTATLMGVKQVYPGRYEPGALLALIEAEQVTFSHCVPTILQMLLNHPQAAQTDLSNWRVIIGGSALPPGLAQQALDLGIDIYAAYGLSETCPILTAATLTKTMLAKSPDEQLRMRCKAGRTAPLVELRIVDPDMNDVPQDGQSTGEIVLRAPWLTQGYLDESERSDELWAGGYMHTGDIGYMDMDGFVQITDRLKDVIKSGGEWISSLELEALISQHANVAQVAVIGIPDEKWSERPLALVVPVDVVQADSDSIQAHIHGYVDQGILSRWAIPQRIEFVTAIDLTSVGKIDKKKLREKYAHANNQEKA